MRTELKRASFWNLIKSEYQKIVFLRFSKIFLVSLIILSLALGLIFSLTISVTQGKAITELQSFDVISVSMLGIDVAAIMLIIFTALLISSEFSTKLIHVSLAVTPNRKRFYLSKLTTYFLLSLVISIVTAFLAYFLGQLILMFNNMPTVSLLDPSIRQFILGCIAMPIFYCLLAVAATFTFGNSACAITFSLGVLLIPGLIRMFSDEIQKLIIPILPIAALHSISGIAERGSFELLSMTTSIIILVVWIFITSLIGIWQFERKDA